MRTIIFSRYVILSGIFISSFFMVNKGSHREKPLDLHSQATLKEALSGKFHIGTALNARQIMGDDPVAMTMVKNQFDAIVAENCMKSGNIHPEENKYNFTVPDKFVEFGTQNNMWINGHTLIWHSQTPRWLFNDKEGNTVSREVLIQRMKDHIQTVVTRYKGRVNTWDVVNEAIEDDGSFRKSKFYNIIGEDFIKLAFQFAHEADAEAELYYNDYSMTQPGKRDAVVKMVKKLQNEGVQIDGIGMQGHIGMDYPSTEEFEKSIEAFSALGVKVMVTEFDLSILPPPWRNQGANVSDNSEYQKKMDPYKTSLPDSVSNKFTARMTDFFRLFLKHQDKIDRVTLWGVNDGDSWKNNWPIRGRTDYPLLFDRKNQPKPVVDSIIKLSLNE